MTDPLSHHTPEALAKAWCYLNVGEWPPFMDGEGKPIDRNNPADQKRMRLMRKAIEARVGRWKCLAAWNEYEFFKGNARLAK